MKILSSGQRRGVTHIIHIADIHVRIGNAAAARVEEYDHVFRRFLDEIAMLPAVRDGTALCAISGDVFHNKGRLDSVAGQRFFLWLNRLLGLLPVVVICGNHDFRQEDPAFTDMIELMVAPYENKEPLFYLRETGTYQWENLCIGVVRIQDTLRAFNTAGIVDDLPAFPKPDAAAGCRVAMFHGTISQSALPSGRAAGSITKGYPLAWFQGYDVVLLGDNHRQQVHVDDGLGLAWGYPGSLVQQDFGEPLLGHGYLLWDVEARRAEAHHIPNPFGWVTIQRSNDEWIMSLGNRDVRPLSKEVAADPAMPQNPHVRIIGACHERIDAQMALAEIGIKPLYIKEAQRAPVDAAEQAADDITKGLLADLNSPAEWEAYVAKDGAIDPVIRGWIQDPDSMALPVPMDDLPEAIRGTIYKRNQDIRKQLNSYHEEASRPCELHRVVLSYMEWENLMCYAKGNWFDFEQIDGRVALLNGANASGKSAMLDVLFMALFGKPTASRREFNKTAMSAKALHDHRDERDSCYVRLRLEADGVQYEIVRTFSAKEETLGTKSCKVSMGKDVVAEGTMNVAAWVARHIGTSEQMLMGSVLCQHDHYSYFFQDEKARNELLEQALHMKTITEFEAVLGEAVNAHKHIVGAMTSYHMGMGTASQAVDPEELSASQAERDRLEGSLGSLEVEANRLAVAAGTNAELIDVGQDDIDALEGELAGKGGALGPQETRKAIELQGALNQRKAALGRCMPAPVPNEGSLSLEKEIAGLDAIVANEPPMPRMPLGEAEDIEQGYAKWKTAADVKLLLQAGAQARLWAEKAHADLADATRCLDRLQVMKPTNAPARAASATGKPLAEWKEHIELTRAAIAEHTGAMPVQEMALGKCNAAIAAYKAWKASWGVDDPLLAAIEAEALADEARGEVAHVDSKLSSLPAPKGKPHVLAIERGELACAMERVRMLGANIEALVAATPVPCRPLYDRKIRCAWEAQEAEWARFVATVPSATAADLKDEERILQEALNAKAERDTLHAEAAEIETIEFNPLCAACQKQPKYIRLRTIRDRLEALDAIAAPGEGAAARARALREDLIPARVDYDRRRVAMEADVAAWAEARRQGAEAERIAGELAVLQEEQARWAQGINAAEAAWTAKLREAEGRACRMRKILDETPGQEAAHEDAQRNMACALVFEAWNTRLVELRSEEADAARGFAQQWAFEEADARASVQRLAAEAERLARFVEEHDRWEADMALAREAKGAHRVWNRWDSSRREQMDVVKRLEWLAEMAALMDETKAHAEGPMVRIKLAERIANIRRAQAYAKWKLVKAEIEAIRPQWKDANERLARLQAADASHREHEARAARIADALAMMAERHDALRELQRRFVGDDGNGFKTYIYTNRVIPLIEANVNEFLGIVDTFRLKILNRKARFVYMLEDRGNTPTIDNASGYQRFVVSLAMRVALARIGAVGQNVRHLFLDEGFTACDAENLQKTGDLLRDILRIGGYRSILMMSHLDTIRDAAEVRITVSREEGATSSRLAFGQPPAGATIPKPRQKAAPKPRIAPLSAPTEPPTPKPKAPPRNRQPQ